MQDKEFDKLFSSKFDDFEVEPTPAVWQGINAELGDSKRKKLVYLLSIAASIMVLLAAGVLFLVHRDDLVKPVKRNFAFNHPAKTNLLVKETRLKSAVQPKVALTAANKLSGNVIANKKMAVTPKQVITTPKPVIAQQLQTPVSAAADPLIVVEKQPLPDTSRALAAAVNHQPEKPAIVAENIPAATKPQDAPTVKRHKVRSLGDVLNVVIAAVDKRKDKVLEFSDNDDDESTLTSVNLGFIKVKKQD